MPTQSGHMVLADISGYTAFVADTELEHSREILNELLETIVRSIAEHLEIGQIEGDAIFALGERMPADPEAWLEECFLKFHRHLNRIKDVTTCPCRACANVGILTLKFICHYGEYLPQTFLDKTTYVGNAVNMSHRLLKNKVPSREYLLVTDEALAHFPVATRERMTAHREAYDLGAVDCHWMDLSALRADPRARDQVKTVDDEHAELRYEAVAEAPTDVVWQVLTDPAQRQRLMRVRRIDYKPGARSTLLGGEYHCDHGSYKSVLRVGEAIEPERLTITFAMGSVLAWATTQLEEVDGHRTRIVSRFHFDRPRGVSGAVQGFIAKQIMSRHSDAYAKDVALRAEELVRSRGVAVTAVRA